MSEQRKVVVALSGGMDSATLLWYFRAEGDKVAALSVGYGQKHRRELDRARDLAALANVQWTFVNVGGLSTLMQNSALTDSRVGVPEGHYQDASMKQTVVPNRNMLLLAMGTAHAISLGYGAVGYGAHAGDHAIYPDCRREFVSAMAETMAVCHYDSIELVAPFLTMTKGDIVELGLELGVPFERTWTCYKGGKLACGKCGACTERLEAFAEAGIADPIGYEKA